MGILWSARTFLWRRHAGERECQGEADQLDQLRADVDEEYAVQLGRATSELG